MKATEWLRTKYINGAGKEVRRGIETEVLSRSSYRHHEWLLTSKRAQLRAFRKNCAISPHNDDAFSTPVEIPVYICLCKSRTCNAVRSRASSEISTLIINSAFLCKMLYKNKKMRFDDSRKRLSGSPGLLLPLQFYPNGSLFPKQMFSLSRRLSRKI